MNKLNGTITNIQQSGAIVLADISVDGHLFSAMLIDSNEQSDWLKIGNIVSVVFKETEVSIAKNLSGKISLRNRMQCQIKTIRKGELLSEISLRFGQYILTSVITTRAVMSLDLQTGDEVEALVKANEVSVMKLYPT
jgi:molybdate transport system regulatory protein